MAVTRCGQLRFILGAENIKMKTKMKIYKSAVGSLFTYGSEAWQLSEKCLRTLNGANASCLHRFSGKTRIEEAREATCTYSLCKDIRRRRLAWLGHILRMKDSKEGEPRLVKIAVKVQHEMDGGGNILMDAPTHRTFADLEREASNRQAWKSHSERKFGRSGRKNSKKRRKVRALCPSNRRSNNKVGKWVGTGAEAVWVGSAPAPTTVTPPVLSPEAPTFSPTKTLIDPSPPIVTTEAKHYPKKIQSQLPLAWRQSGKVVQITLDGKKPKNSNPRSQTKQKSGKSTSLTDAQRAAWAHAHYIIHHGTTHDAARLLMHQKIVRDIPPTALESIRRMAAMRVPTWEQAAAVVFSSSEDSDDSLEASARDPTSTSATVTASHQITGTPLAAGATLSPTATKTMEKRQYRTRSKTARIRELAAETEAATKAVNSPSPAPKQKTRRRREAPQPSSRPRQVRIAPSQIQGAGLGLYLMESVDANAWIARYSGDPLTRAECNDRWSSQYRVQVHNNLFLDAADPKHFEGRYINDARGSKFKTNARFASNYATNKCSTTGHTWVRIYATRRIEAGEEIFIDYGEGFWESAGRHDGPSTTTKVSEPTSPAAQDSSTSSVWAAPAPMPELTPSQISLSTNGSRESGKSENISTAHRQTASWQSQVPAPATPMIIGHSNTTDKRHTPTPMHFPPSLSPITSRTPPNPRTKLNEIYSFTQLHNLEDTILLPLRIVNPLNDTQTIWM